MLLKCLDATTSNRGFIPNFICVLGIALIACVVVPRQTQADDRKNDCKFALVVGVGFTEPNKNAVEANKEGEVESRQEQIAQRSASAIIQHLTDDWGFQVQNDGNPVLNGAATKKEIFKQFQGLEDRITGRDNIRCPELYIKIHLQGHGTSAEHLKTRPPADADLRTPAPDDFSHAALTLADGYLFDFELDAEIQKLAAAMTKQKYKKCNLIVQVDCCYSQYMFATYTSLDNKLPGNVTIAWSNKGKCKVEGSDKSLKTPWTKGFEAAFQDAEGKEINPSVEAAHRSAAEYSAKAEITLLDDTSKEETTYIWNGSQWRSGTSATIPEGSQVTASNGIKYTWNGSQWMSAAGPAFPGVESAGFLPSPQNPPVVLGTPRSDTHEAGGNAPAIGGSRSGEKAKPPEPPKAPQEAPSAGNEGGGVSFPAPGGGGGAALNSTTTSGSATAPPDLPDYDQPPAPVPNEMWTPGYWGYVPAGFFWVPGTWVVAPAPGLLWTPGYWGFAGGLYHWNEGYWGPHVGFYGGVNYGFGYGGVGFVGGVWEHGVFRYNTAVAHVDTTAIHNTYVDRIATTTEMNMSRTSFNGGSGTTAQPTAAEKTAANEPHTAPTSEQTNHEHLASTNRSCLASENNGHPTVAATAKAGEFNGKGVVAAHGSKSVAGKAETTTFTPPKNETPTEATTHTSKENSEKSKAKKEAKPPKPAKAQAESKTKEAEHPK